MSNQEDRSSSLSTEIVALRQRIKELEAESIELQQARQKLKEEHSFRKGVIEHAAEGICVCHAIPEFPFVKFSLWNHRMKEITGYSMEEINCSGWYQTMYRDPEIQDKAIQRLQRCERVWICNTNVGVLPELMDMIGRLEYQHRY